MLSEGVRAHFLDCSTKVPYHIAERCDGGAPPAKANASNLAAEVKLSSTGMTTVLDPLPLFTLYAGTIDGPYRAKRVELKEGERKRNGQMIGLACLRTNRFWAIGCPKTVA